MHRRFIQQPARAEANTKSVLRGVFMGTPDFAATILKRVLESTCVEVVAVFTQPDRPAGRGRAMQESPVKKLAESLGIPTFQPKHFTPTPEGDAAYATLAGYAPDVLLVAAYGLLLPQRVLDIPKLMPMNVHASLLPRYRGAAPIQRAILNDDVVTGVTIMHMTAGLDSGPILLQRAVAIGGQDTSATMHAELAHEGGELLVQAVERLISGFLSATPQEEKKSSYAPKLRKEEGLLDFCRTSRQIHAHIRGMTPWPGAFMTLRLPGRPDLDIRVEPGLYPLPPELKEAATALAPGRSSVKEIHATLVNDEVPSFGRILGLAGKKALLVSCADESYAFTSLRPANRKSMDASAFYNGYLAGAENAFFIGRTT